VRLASRSPDRIREDAQAAVDAARFEPEGERGLSPYVRAGGYDGTENYTDEQNEETLVIVHVEGQAGLDNLDDILAVEGNRRHLPRAVRPLPGPWASPAR